MRLRTDGFGDDSGRMRARSVAIGSFVVGVIGAAIAAATFPYGHRERLTTAYLVAVAVAGTGIAWGVAMMVSRRWRWLGVGFAVIATAYIVGLSYLLIHELPG
jgi:uncharacterized membrane protein